MNVYSGHVMARSAMLCDGGISRAKHREPLRCINSLLEPGPLIKAMLPTTTVKGN